MASVALPDVLRNVLDMRSDSACVCPADVAATMGRIPYFGVVKTAPATRFTHLMREPREATATGSQTNSYRENWNGRGDARRGGGGGGRHGGGYGNSGGHSGGHSGGGYGRSSASAAPPSDDGFQMWSNRRGGARQERRPAYNENPSTFRAPRAMAGAGSDSAPAPAPAPASAAPAPTFVAVARDGPPEVNAVVYVPPVVAQVALADAQKFSSAGVKAMEHGERMLARVKGKINRMGHSTYDQTKVFMQQILSSDDTDFLDELMEYVFQKAATESAFCILYARLIHELADEFTHFRTVMRNIFRDYTAIFTEVTTAPDADTETYKAFVEAQERKKYRRGYSQFVAELVKLGEVDTASFFTLLQQIVAVLEVIHMDAGKTLLCEEYIDCLANMCASAVELLRAHPGDIRGRLEALIAKPKATVPGFTNKGRFALMDLVDGAKKAGWA